MVSTSAERVLTTLRNSHSPLSRKSWLGDCQASTTNDMRPGQVSAKWARANHNSDNTRRQTYAGASTRRCGVPARIARSIVMARARWSRIVNFGGPDRHGHMLRGRAQGGFVFVAKVANMQRPGKPRRCHVNGSDPGAENAQRLLAHSHFHNHAICSPAEGAFRKSTRGA